MSLFIDEYATRTKDICDGENYLRRLGKYLSDEKIIRRSLNS